NDDDIETVNMAATPGARAVIRRRCDGGVQHDPARPGRRRHVHRFDIVVVRAYITDMREREGDDLPRIGGIGKNLLVAGHGGVETDLAYRVAGCAEANTFENGAVGEDEHR